MEEDEIEEQEEFLDNNDIQEEMDGEGIVDDEMEDTGDEIDDNENENGMVQYEDESIQGFFEHRGAQNTNEEPVFAIALHPSHPSIAASGGGDDKSYLWNIETGDKIFNLGEHSDSCIALSFNSDGKYIASGGLDGKVQIFSVLDGSLVVQLEGPSEWIQWHPRGNVILAAGEDATLWMWAVPSGTCMSVLTGHTESITCGQFTPDGKAIVTGSQDGSIIVWDPRTGAALQRWSSVLDGRFHQSPITALTINKDSSVIISGDEEGNTLLLNRASHKILGSLVKHEESVETIQFSDHLPYVATGSVDGLVNVWDLSTNALRYTLSHPEAVTKVRWSPSGVQLISACLDGNLRIWDSRTGELKETRHGHQNSILDFEIRTDSMLAVTASDDGVSLVFSLQTDN